LKSSVVNERIKTVPIPFQTKILSVIADPPNKPTIENETIVTIGIKAFLKA
jgi:hypothetical protein